MSGIDEVYLNDRLDRFLSLRQDIDPSPGIDAPPELVM